MRYRENVSSIIKKHLEEALKDFGELTWAYVVLPKKDISSIFCVTNYPDEWVKRYKENNLQYIDPVVISALNRLTPFSWDENLITSSEFHFSEHIEQARKFGVTNGHTFLLNDYNNNLVTLSFIINVEQKKKITQIFIKNKGNIYMLLASVHQTYLHLTAHPEKKVFHSQKSIRFTERENAILYWVSVGKTYQETAIILAIKTRTIKFHMSNIVKKLGVVNARHAIRLSMELQLIKPIDSLS